MAVQWQEPVNFLYFGGGRRMLVCGFWIGGWVRGTWAFWGGGWVMGW